MQDEKVKTDGNGKTDIPSALRSATFRWTARDQYAAAAMQALIPTVRPDARVGGRIDQIAEQAYAFADAMLRKA
ncbi:MAG: hypothetical protein JSV86_10555 [Gemmatimonadota bacterium]|nr:MAG: hypothetical protein JSV86_10555 [Gemmatimonadota bacterium]